MGGTNGMTDNNNKDIFRVVSTLLNKLYSLYTISFDSFETSGVTDIRYPGF